jgi:hypothetical protein
MQHSASARSSQAATAYTHAVPASMLVITAIYYVIVLVILMYTEV